MHNKDITLVFPTACFIQKVQGCFRLYPWIYISFSQSVFREGLSFRCNIFYNSNLSFFRARIHNFVIYSDPVRSLLNLSALLACYIVWELSNVTEDGESGVNLLGLTVFVFLRFYESGL
jgi:hypothetical protein